MTTNPVILQNLTVIWLVAGGILILIESLTMPGIGFLYAGLAAISVGGLLSLDYIDQTDVVAQLSWFFGLTAVWAALLWKPMKRFRYHNSDKEYQNIVGSIATVKSEALVKKKHGKVEWSGTIMKADLSADSAVDSVEAGQQVKIIALEGNRVIVKTLEEIEKASGS